MMAEHTNTLEKQDGFQSQWGFIMAAVGLLRRYGKRLALSDAGFPAMAG